MQNKGFLVSFVAFCLFTGAARAAVPVADDYSAVDTDPAFKSSGVIEAGANYHDVTNGFGNWFGQYLRGEIQTDKDNRWNAELLNQQEFGSTGEYASVGNTHVFNPDWYSVVSAGAGADGDFQPRYRVDAFINRKWLEQRQLVTTFGLGEYKAMDRHSDQSVFLGGAYYFQNPWIVQGGIRFNKSYPGSVNSTSQFVAVTQGRDKEHFITLRYGFGKEAYQIIGNDQTLSNFHSQVASLQLKEWLGTDWGIDTLAERYHNPSYNRTGLTFGVFKEF